MKVVDRFKPIDLHAWLHEEDIPPSSSGRKLRAAAEPRELDDFEPEPELVQIETMKYANGDEYEGEWSEGKPHGRGTMTRAKRLVGLSRYCC